MWAVLLAAVLTVLGPQAAPSAARPGQDAPAAPPAAAAQVLTWTAGDDITAYTAAPTTAVAGPATVVFENSAATGNTTGMPHTLTFVTSDPEFNDDVQLNILANPDDDTGGRHTAEVTLSPGRYLYHCTIPGHGRMQGILVVTEGSGEDTTAPETSATVDGVRNADGAYVGSASVTVSAADEAGGSGVDRVQYAVDATGDWLPYTAPVVVDRVGGHTVRHRAFDKAGNASAEKSVTFTVVAAPPRDTTPPVTGVTVEGTRNSAGAYVGRARVTVSASDAGGSGVAAVEYALDGGPYLAYGAPVVVDRPGAHTVTYRASDRAGNTAAARDVSFAVVAGGGVPAPPCPEWDERSTVIVGTVDTGVPNRVTDDRCRINELIEDEREWTSHALFLKHVRAVLDALLRAGVVDEREHGAVLDAARASGIGRPGQTEGYRTIMDGSAESVARWEHVGGGSFAPNGDGSITSGTTRDGLGMLWFPQRKYGDFSLRLQWRDDAPGTGNANSGVLVRFPWVHGQAEEPRPEWAAIKFGHEVQVLDRPDGDPYKTGSVYGFDRVGLAGAGVTQKGTWNDYEIRVVGQHYSVFRNGVLINEFDNTGGQEFSPPRADDPGTDGRRFASGYLGLQVHGTTDVVSYRDIRVKDL
ncbi:OmpL47-type beta-barrel domain-containing protein [Streptomyces sp. NPDC003522]